LPAPLF